jgi:thiosulfate/3-mercaptopyruvate sulfurtransferase
MSDKYSSYAHPEVLVSVDWLKANAGSVRIVECDEDILLYETGHIPGAVKLDWHTELNDPVRRDYLDGAAFSNLMASKGISRATTVVLYGDRSNWWATYAFWVLKLFGHPDVRLLDGGRAKWIASGGDLTTDKPEPDSSSNYPIVERQDSAIRAFRDDVLAHLGQPLIDVRTPEEYRGERLHLPDFPNEGATRGGHIPTAHSISWSKAVQTDETFRPVEELRELYLENTGFSSDADFIAYCRIGERSSHTWFVLKYLLGIKSVRNYDGSWTEWGNLVGVPIVTGAEPGIAA